MPILTSMDGVCLKHELQRGERIQATDIEPLIGWSTGRPVGTGAAGKACLEWPLQRYFWLGSSRVRATSWRGQQR
jgi:hypothetical protein